MWLFNISPKDWFGIAILMNNNHSTMCMRIPSAWTLLGDVSKRREMVQPCPRQLLDNSVVWVVSWWWSWCHCKSYTWICATSCMWRRSASFELIWWYCGEAYEKVSLSCEFESGLRWYYLESICCNGRNRITNWIETRKMIVVWSKDEWRLLTHFEP